MATNTQKVLAFLLNIFTLHVCEVSNTVRDGWFGVLSLQFLTFSVSAVAYYYLSSLLHASIVKRMLHINSHLQGYCLNNEH